MPSDRAWLAALPDDLARQRAALSALLGFCEASSSAASLSVGCSIGRGVADPLSDVDAAIGVHAPRGLAGLKQVRAVEQALVALLPGVGGLVDVLRQEEASTDFVIRRVFAQFDDRLQLDLAVVAEAEVRRGAAAPDFVPLHWSDEFPGQTVGRSAHQVTDVQLGDWTFLAWRGLLDTDKYLRRGSLWEAHHRLQEVRELIWKVWATSLGAAYPWHGLSQVLDHDPAQLPPGIEGTLAGLDAGELQGALLAVPDLLDQASAAAAARVGAEIDPAMARYVRGVIGSS